MNTVNFITIMANSKPPEFLEESLIITTPGAGLLDSVNKEFKEMTGMCETFRANYKINTPA